MLTAEQTTRLLALPIEWRRRLAEMEGPGWLHEPGRDHGLYPSALESCRPPEKARRLLDGILDDGWAWAPCDRLAWLEATGAKWYDANPRGAGVMDRMPSLHMEEARPGDVWERNPIDAALVYMEQHPCPE